MADNRTKTARSTLVPWSSKTMTVIGQWLFSDCGWPACSLCPPAVQSLPEKNQWLSEWWRQILPTISLVLISGFALADNKRLPQVYDPGPRGFLARKPRSVHKSPRINLAHWGPTNYLLQDWPKGREDAKFHIFRDPGYIKNKIGVKFHNLNPSDLQEPEKSVQSVWAI